MKLFLYTLAGLLAIGLTSCRKNYDSVTIQQYDNDAIVNYIQQNGLTAMHKDAGDTTGIYYQVIKKGTGAFIDYPDTISYVYTLKTLDGGYVANDTIANHVFNYLGHVGPAGLQLALKNIVQQKGAIYRLLIPSRLAYGRNGVSAGSQTINGNQCLDYTITLIDDQNAYDEQSILNHMKAKGYSTTDYKKYTVSVNGVNVNYYCKVNVAGSGNPALVSSVDSVQYEGFLFNGSNFQPLYPSDGTYTPLVLYDVIAGFQKVLMTNANAGSKVSFMIPSILGYGNTPNNNSSVAIPAFSCLYFNLNVLNVNN